MTAHDPNREVPPMDRTDEDRAAWVRSRLQDLIAESVTSASASGRTVEDPRVAARAVAEALERFTGVLAEAAVVFDREAVESVLAAWAPA
jgi:hypothetical protein